MVESPHLDCFDGPLDLLHELITRRALDITTISLAAVAEQYLAEVARLVEQDLDRLTGYLVIASRLLLIKSQALLPRPVIVEPEVEEDAAALVRQMEEYQRYKEAAERLREMQASGLRMFAREAPLSVAARPLGGSGSPADLAAALRRALSLAPETPRHESLAAPRFIVAAKVAELRAALGATSEVSFSAVVAQASCRQEVVAFFLALLELLRCGYATAKQTSLFGDILLAKLPEVQHPFREPNDDKAEGSADRVDADVDDTAVAGGDEELVYLVGNSVEHGAEPGHEERGTHL